MIKKKSLLKIIILFLVFFGILGMKSYSNGTEEGGELWYIFDYDISGKLGITKDLVLGIYPQIGYR